MQTHDSSVNYLNLTKEEKYNFAITSIQGLCKEETDITANLANASAVLKEIFNWWWIGFYLVQDNQLVLGPFQGPVACTRISKGRGVCGKSWENAQTYVVKDVNTFPDHIACSAQSKSEIVIPLLKNGKVLGVLDADSELFAHFDQIDAMQLEKIAVILTESM